MLINMNMIKQFEIVTKADASNDGAATTMLTKIPDELSEVKIIERRQKSVNEKMRTAVISDKMTEHGESVFLHLSR